METRHYTSKSVSCSVAFRRETHTVALPFYPFSPFLSLPLLITLLPGLTSAAGVYTWRICWRPLTCRTLILQESCGGVGWGLRRSREKAHCSGWWSRPHTWANENSCRQRKSLQREREREGSDSLTTERLIVFLCSFKSPVELVFLYSLYSLTLQSIRGIQLKQVLIGALRINGLVLTENAVHQVRPEPLSGRIGFNGGGSHSGI